MVAKLVMALDVGDRYVGVAISDGSTAVPLGSFHRAQGGAEDEILRLCKERAVTNLVAGLPLSEDGSRTEQCESIERFCRRLERRLTPLRIEYVDEYLSTQEVADRLQLSARKGRSYKERGVIDAMSAVVILERYLAQGCSRS